MEKNDTKYKIIYDKKWKYLLHIMEIFIAKNHTTKEKSS